MQAKEIKKIMSSRYSLFVCRIDTADNYIDNLVDNECCHDWSLLNKSDINISTPYLFEKCTNVSRLIPADHNDPTVNEEIRQEQDYLHMVRFWLRFSSWCKTIFDWYELEEFMYDVVDQKPLGASIYQSLKEMDTLIRRACYHGTDISQVENVIQQEINSTKLLSHLYGNWKKDNLVRSSSTR